MTPARRFLADEMLGKLARWLRFMGLDVEYAKNEGDAAILAHARREDRFLLTRDVQLAERAHACPGSFLVTCMDPAAQLEEVVDALGLEPDADALLSRCGVCNVVLVDADATHAALPRSVRERAKRGVLVVRACPRCRRAYWEGSHAIGIRHAIARIRDAEPGGA